MIEISEILGSVKGVEYSEEESKYQAAKKFLEKERAAYLEMDKLFCSFLEAYIEKYKEGQGAREKFKKVFLVCSFILLFISVIAPIVFSFFLLFRPVPVISAVTTIGAMLIEILSAIIVLPRTIASYLFDKKESTQIVQIIENMQTYNEKKHDHLFRE